MQSQSHLFQTAEPWVLKTLEPYDTVSKRLAPAIREKGFKLIVLNGDKMQSAAGFYQEWTRGLHMAEPLSRNFNALSECLADLEWLPASGYIFLISRAENVLKSEKSETLDGFLDILKLSGAEWREPKAYGRPEVPPPTPFHAVFLCATENWRPELQLMEFKSKT